MGQRDPPRPGSERIGDGSQSDHSSGPVNEHDNGNLPYTFRNKVAAEAHVLFFKDQIAQTYSNVLFG